MSTGNGRKRRVKNQRVGITRFMVPHESSLWFARTILLGLIGTGLMLGFISWMHHQSVLEAMVANGFVTDPQLLDQYRRIALINGVVVIAAGSVFVTVMACFLMHRIAGPVYRMRQHMLGIIDGQDVTELRFRDGDRLQDVCDTYNQLLYKLEALDPKPENEPQS